jgi:uncharacterized protein YuzE
MKIEYDREVDALYVRLQEKYVARTVEIEEGLNLDLDDSGKLIGLEILDTLCTNHPYLHLTTRSA